MKTSFKKIVVVMAVICVLFAMFALAASATEAETAPVSGTVTSGSNTYEWSYDESTTTLTINGYDGSWNWPFSTLAGDDTYKAFVAAYGSSVKTITITGTIRKMANNVSVLGCPNVETLNFVANNRFQTASSFFGGLASLKVVNFGSHTSDCVDLTNIDTMHELQNTFKGCSSIEKVLLSSTTNFKTGDGTKESEQVYYILPSMFEDCTSLSDIEIPGWVTEIKTKAFKNCTSLTRLTVPASVTTIADDAFDGCTLTIVGTVGSAAETFANAHENITFEEYDPYTAIEGRDISWYWDASTATLHFKGTGTTIADYKELVAWTPSWGTDHFEPWKDIIKSVKHVEMQDCVNLTTIPGLFFSDYTALETLVLPESVTTFGNDDTFRLATSLHSIAVGSPENIVDGVLDLSRITKLSTQTFDAALKAGVDYVVYFNPSASVSGDKNSKYGTVTGTFNSTKATSVKMYVLPTATAVPETLVSNFPDVFSYKCYTWEEYKTRWPLATDTTVSGTFSGDWSDGTWNFDIGTGIFEMNSTKSGWCQWEFSNNPTLKTAWSVLKMYVKEMRFTGNGSKIYADGNFDFSWMPYLEKFVTTSNVSDIQIQHGSGFNKNVNLKTVGATDGVVELNRFGTRTAKFTNCTSIEKIKIGQSNVFTSAMLEDLTGLSSVEFTGTDPENVAALGAAGALVFASDVRIDVGNAEVKAAVEALGYTNVHGPAAAVKSGMTLNGYQLRNADYNGLRTVYTFKLTDAKNNNPDYTLVEYGAILASSAAKNAYGTALTQDAEGNWVTANAKVMKMAVGNSTGVINKTLASSTDDVISFCVAVVRYTNNFDTNLYNVGYEIWQNNETDEYSVVYTDYNTGLETTSSWAETSIYAVTLGRIKEGLEDPNNEIHWGVLTGKGAVTFTKGTDYDDTWTDMNGAAFGDTFTFLDVQAVDNSGNTSGMSTFSVFEDENGKYVIIYKNGNTTRASWDYGSQIRRSGYDANESADPKNRSWFVNNAKAPNPYIENAKLWEKIDAIVLAENVTVSQYAFNSTVATQLTYAPGTTGFDRAFTNANSLSSIFPTNYGGVVSNKTEGVFDLSKTSGITSFNETFKGCYAAKYIRIPATVTSISDKAFNSCTSLLSVVTGDNEFVDGVIDFRDSALRTISYGNSANEPIYGNAAAKINKITTVYLPALADGESFTIGAKTFNTAINFRQATFSQAVYDFVANSGVEGMTYTDINGNEWTSSSSTESMAGWSNIIVD